jgi:hypothetical protein
MGGGPIGIDERVWVLTRTGSVYEIARAGARWFFRANNKPNPNSRRLDPGEWWPIVPHPIPWPPVLGMSLMLLSPECPGRGKVTSLVRGIRKEVVVNDKPEDPNDRFGTPPEAFEAAMASHGKDNPFVRIGMYVPTRQEVATMDPKILFEILDCWIWESPTELIPRPGQIQQLREVLLRRPDVEDPAVQEVVAMVTDYLEEVHGERPS